MSLLLEALKCAERQKQGLAAETPPPSPNPEVAPAVAIAGSAQAQSLPEFSMVLEPSPAPDLASTAMPPPAEPKAAAGPPPPEPEPLPRGIPSAVLHSDSLVRNDDHAQTDKSRAALLGVPSGKSALSPPRKRHLVLGGLALAVAAGTAGALFWLELQMAAPPILVQTGHPPPGNGISAGENPSPPRTETVVGIEPAPSKSLPLEPEKAERPGKSPAPEKPAKPAGTPPSTTPQELEAPPIAIRRSEQTITIHPATEAGYAAMVSGNLNTARDHYQKALQSDQRSRDALLGLAVTAVREGRHEEAARRYEQILALDPRDPDASAGIALLHGAMDPVAFESRLKTLAQERGDSAALHHALGSLLARQNRWGEAQEAFFRAVTLAPLAADYLFNLAVSLDHLGQYTQARNYYRKALDSGKAEAVTFSRQTVQARITSIDALAP